MRTKLPASFLPAKFQVLSGSALKLIAITLMLIDHTGLMILYNYPATTATLFSFGGVDYSWYRIFRDIGRAAFPIFCFLLVEGFLHTHDRKKYALRLFLFALVSEIPFDLAIMGRLFDPVHQNVFFTLLIGLLAMMLCDYFRMQAQPVAQVLVLILAMVLAWALHTDYGYRGVLLIELLYIFRYNRMKQVVAGAVAFSWETTAPLAFIPVWFYNGKRGKSGKWFFYWFYPVHLLILWGVKTFLLPILISI